MYVTEHAPKAKTEDKGEDSTQETADDCRRHSRLVAEWSSWGKADEADERISAALIPSLWSLYGNSDEEVREHLLRFRRANRNHLRFVEREHSADCRVAPLLHQPELLLILDRLEADPRGLLDAWPLTVPRIWLEALAEAWGSPL
jgi:hypothetical protein